MEHLLGYSYFAITAALNVVLGRMGAGVTRIQQLVDP